MKQHIANALLLWAAAMIWFSSLAWTTFADAVGGTSFSENQAGAWLGIAGANTLNGNTTGESTLLVAVKKFINWALWLLGMIAIMVLLYGGFNMITAAGDDAKYKKGFAILRQAGIGLIFVWVSWIIVQSIMWFIGFATK